MRTGLYTNGYTVILVQYFESTWPDTVYVYNENKFTESQLRTEHAKLIFNDWVYMGED